jgi:hypothetical protein
MLSTSEVSRLDADWSFVNVPFSTSMSIGAAAARLNAVARALRPAYAHMIVYGCSVRGKIAYWAAVTAPPGLYDRALIDSGGTMGGASAKVVGPCGETWEAARKRWPQWYVPSAQTLSPPRTWPADVGTLMIDACKHTNFSFGVARYNHWNNYEGTLRTVETARAAGCNVELREGYVAHCGFFAGGTCSHSC